LARGAHKAGVCVIEALDGSIVQPGRYELNCLPGCAMPRKRPRGRFYAGIYQATLDRSVWAPVAVVLGRRHAANIIAPRPRRVQILNTAKDAPPP
jgi:hypothetical protein